MLFRKVATFKEKEGFGNYIRVCLFWVETLCTYRNCLFCRNQRWFKLPQRNPILCQTAFQFLWRKLLNYAESTESRTRFVCLANAGVAWDSRKKNPAKCVFTILQKTVDASLLTNCSINQGRRNKQYRLGTRNSAFVCFFCNLMKIKKRMGAERFLSAVSAGLLVFPRFTSSTWFRWCWRLMVRGPLRLLVVAVAACQYLCLSLWCPVRIGVCRFRRRQLLGLLPFL